MGGCVLLVMMTEPGDGEECGVAGVAPGGVQVQGEGEVRYECEEGYVMVGEVRRSCMSNGSWSGHPPLCSKILLSDNSYTVLYTGQSLAYKQSALQSSTLAQHTPGRAVDGGNIQNKQGANTKHICSPTLSKFSWWFNLVFIVWVNDSISIDLSTCSSTTTTGQRWWQVVMETTVVESVTVTLGPESPQHFTIFVIQLMEGNKALYKPCSVFEGEVLDSTVMFVCNGGAGHVGEFVYIRDEREGEHSLSLCEVQVFAPLGM